MVTWLADNEASAEIYLIMTRSSEINFQFQSEFTLVRTIRANSNKTSELFICSKETLHEYTVICVNPCKSQSTICNKTDNLQQILSFTSGMNRLSPIIPTDVTKSIRRNKNK